MKPSEEKKRNKNIKQRVEAAQKCCSIPFPEPSQFHIVWYDHQSPWLCLWAWECINFHASLGHRAHLLHCYCNPHMHTHTLQLWLSVIQLSTHNYFFSVSVFLMPAHNQSLILSTVPRRSGHQKCTQCSVRHAEFHSFLLFLSLFDEQHTHTHRSIVVYVASGQDYELNLPLSCTSLLLPPRTSDLWISQLKKKKKPLWSYC